MLKVLEETFLNATKHTRSRVVNQQVEPPPTLQYRTHGGFNLGSISDVGGCD
jgi:hypothetical protein